MITVLRVGGGAIQRDGREVQPKVLDELLLGPESQAPHRRMQAVGADDEVELPGRTAVECHLDAGLGLSQCRDGVVVEILSVVARSGRKNGRQVAARDLDPVPAELSGDPPDLTAVVVDRHQSFHVGGGRPDRLETLHLLDDREGRSAHVDRATTGRLTTRPLDDGDLEALPREEVGERRSGDAGADDEYRADRHEPIFAETRTVQVE